MCCLEEAGTEICPMNLTNVPKYFKFVFRTNNEPFNNNMFVIYGRWRPLDGCKILPRVSGSASTGSQGYYFIYTYYWVDILINSWWTYFLCAYLWHMQTSWTLPFAVSLNCHLICGEGHLFTQLGLGSWRCRTIHKRRGHMFKFPIPRGQQRLWQAHQTERSGSVLGEQDVRKTCLSDASAECMELLNYTRSQIHKVWLNMQICMKNVEYNRNAT